MKLISIQGKIHKKTLCKNRGLYVLFGGDAGNRTPDTADMSRML
jgi:hypothetical protein